MNDEYRDRMNRVIQYIKQHSHQKLSLDMLADVSGFSKYHFTRIFTSIAGVSPIAFVNRERLHKSVQLLRENRATILEISNQCGFESVSAFNALFKKHYGKTPSEVRSDIRKNSNYPLYFSKKQAEISSLDDYNRQGSNHLLRRAWAKMITIKELPDYEVACVRHVGSYLDSHLAWEQLGRWASEQGVSPNDQYFIGVSLDDGNLVEEWACRYDACVTIPSGLDKHQHQTHVEFKTLSGGMYAVYPYYGAIEDFVLAYESVFGLWLPNSEYDADDRPSLEFCLNNPAKDAEGKCKVDLYIPIKKRS